MLDLNPETRSLIYFQYRQPGMDIGIISNTNTSIWIIQFLTYSAFIY